MYDSFLSNKYRPNKSGPFAFVRFRSREEAEAVIHDWDGRQLEDATLLVSPASDNKQQASGSSFKTSNVHSELRRPLCSGETTKILDRNDLLLRLESVRAWSEEDACVTRRTTVEVHGIPLHGWSVANMEKISSAWGEVIEVDKEMMNTDDFHAPRTVTDTESFKRIQNWAILDIDGRGYDVLIQELEKITPPATNATPEESKTLSNFKKIEDPSNKEKVGLECRPQVPSKVGEYPLLTGQAIRLIDVIVGEINLIGKQGPTNVPERKTGAVKSSEESGKNIDELEAREKIMNIGAHIRKISIDPNEIDEYSVNGPAQLGVQPGGLFGTNPMELSDAKESFVCVPDTVEPNTRRKEEIRTSELSESADIEETIAALRKRKCKKIKAKRRKKSQVRKKDSPEASQTNPDPEGIPCVCRRERGRNQ